MWFYTIVKYCTPLINTFDWFHLEILKSHVGIFSQRLMSTTKKFHCHRIHSTLNHSTHPIQKKPTSLTYFRSKPASMEKEKSTTSNFYTGSNDITSEHYIIILVRQRSDKVNTPDILTANSSSLKQLHKQHKATIAATANITKPYSRHWAAAEPIFSYKALVELRPLYRLTVEAYNKAQ